MELRQIRYFAVLAEELHFHRAATRLNITQPPLSTAIRALEDDLGVQLLERGRNRKVSLTASGESFRGWANRILADSDSARLSVQRVHEGSAGSLAVGHTDDYVAEDLPELLYEFSRTHPGVLLRMVQDTSYALPGRLKNAELDCIFTVKPLPAILADCESLALPATPIVVVVSSKHRLAGRQRIRLEEICDENFLYSPGERLGVFDSKLARLIVAGGIRLNLSMESLASPLDIEMVRRGHGVTFATRGAVAGRVSGVSLLELEGDDTIVERALVWRTDNRNPTLKRLVSSVVASDWADSLPIQGGAPGAKRIRGPKKGRRR